MDKENRIGEGELIVWNPVFGQVALDYRFAPELCWPRSGQREGRRRKPRGLGEEELLHRPARSGA
jgi:hypothetical protein